MRSKYHRFEDLVTENKRELMEDDRLMQKLETRLEKKRTDESEDNNSPRRIFR